MPGFSACLARVLLATLLIPIQSARPAKTLFFDDFSGRELDRTHWNVIVTGRTVNNEQQAYVDSPDVLSVKDGALEIRSRFRAGFKTPEGRSPGSLAWAGLANTYFWIDPVRNVSGVILMQLLPFVDQKCLEAFAGFERGIYAGLDAGSGQKAA